MYQKQCEYFVQWHISLNDMAEYFTRKLMPLPALSATLDGCMVRAEKTPLQAVRNTMAAEALLLAAEPSPIAWKQLNGLFSARKSAVRRSFLKHG